jgi:hypothetical protein
VRDQISRPDLPGLPSISLIPAVEALAMINRLVDAEFRRWGKPSEDQLRPLPGDSPLIGYWKDLFRCVIYRGPHRPRKRLQRPAYHEHIDMMLSQSPPPKPRVIIASLEENGFTEPTNGWRDTIKNRQRKQRARRKFAMG